MSAAVKYKGVDDVDNLDDDDLDDLEESTASDDEDDEDEDEEDEDESISDSISSVDYEGLDSLDFSKELENKGEVMKKKWMENSPKFKNRIIDISKSRRHAISATNYEMFDDITKNEKILKLSDKMKLVYDRLKEKRKARKKNKRKKNEIF